MTESPRNISSLPDDDEKTEDESKFSLAFASISTDDFKFDGNRATQVLTAELNRFFDKFPAKHTKLVLVDPLLNLKHELLPKRLNILSSPGSTLLTAGCAVVAVGCNKLFKSGGDRLNTQLHKSFGSADELSILTKNTNSGVVAKAGSAYSVNLPPNHPISVQHKVVRVIHVLGPNMNPNRLDYLQDDYAMGEQLLRSAYLSMLDNFEEYIASFSKNPSAAKDEDVAMKSVGFDGTEKSEGNSTGHSGTAMEIDELDGFVIPPYNPPNRTPPPVPGLSLKFYIDPPPGSAYVPFRWTSYGPNVVIYDGYPKANFHVLIVHKQLKLQAISQATTSDLNHLKSMYQLGRKIARDSFQVKCRIGYHALPSLVPLHLHVISEDLSSPRLNSKKHWNSFQHPLLFIHATQVEKDLETSRKVNVRSRAELHDLESTPLECHVCGFKPLGTIKDSLAQLKAHKCSRTEG